MAHVDYDAPRTNVEEDERKVEVSLELLQERRARELDLAESDTADLVVPPDYDIGEEELTAPVVPQQDDEFRCYGCFLVLHQRMQATSGHGEPICRDCV